MHRRSSGDFHMVIQKGVATNSYNSAQLWLQEHQRNLGRVDAEDAARNLVPRHQITAWRHCLVNLVALRVQILLLCQASLLLNISAVWTLVAVIS